MFKSLWVFSITLAASATLIFSALYVPALITSLYKESIIFATFGLDPEVILQIDFNLCKLLPGFILSGEYPQKKSLLNFSPDFFLTKVNQLNVILEIHFHQLQELSF